MGKRGLEENFDGDENAAVADPVDSNKPEDLRILEAVLFASDELMTAARLKTILPGQPDARKIRTMVEKINIQLQKERHPFEVVEIGGGYQFRTIAFYHPWVRQLFKEKAVKKLSIQALECLAIIAYKQPLSKAEIEAIRGVVSDGAMKTLLEKRLVTISGRSDKPGKPLLYSTTQIFLTYFGLNRIEDLPRIEEFEALAREKMDELSLEELTEPDMIEGEEAPGNDEMEVLEEGGSDTSLFEVQVDAEGKGTKGEGGGASTEDIKTAAEPAVSDSDAIVRDYDVKADGDEDFEVRVENQTGDGDSAVVNADVENGMAEEPAEVAQDDAGVATVSDTESADVEETVPEVTTVLEVDVGSKEEERVEENAEAPEATAAFEVKNPDESDRKDNIVAGSDDEKNVSTSGYSHEDATVFDFDSNRAASESMSNGDDAVFEVRETKENVARFSEDDVEFLGGALMETKAIIPEKLKRKKKKGESDDSGESSDSTDAGTDEPEAE